MDTAEDTTAARLLNPQRSHCFLAIRSDTLRLHLTPLLESRRADVAKVLLLAAASGGSRKNPLLAGRTST